MEGDHWELGLLGSVLVFVSGLLYSLGQIVSLLHQNMMVTYLTGVLWGTVNSWATRLIAGTRETRRLLLQSWVRVLLTNLMGWPSHPQGAQWGLVVPDQLFCLHFLFSFIFFPLEMFAFCFNPQLTSVGVKQQRLWCNSLKWQVQIPTCIPCWFKYRSQGVNLAVL